MVGWDNWLTLCDGVDTMICSCGNNYHEYPELFECIIIGDEKVNCIICGNIITLNCNDNKCEDCDSNEKRCEI